MPILLRKDRILRLCYLERRHTPERLRNQRSKEFSDSVHDVQSFLGLSSYFRKICRKFAMVSGPLYALLKKGIAFEFRATIRCLRDLKKKLTETSVLSIFNPENPSEHCYASSQDFGAVLLQRKADNRYHPVFYFSKRTSEVEVRYHSYELETLALFTH